MKIYDKAQWHIDAGENESIVIARFKSVFTFLQKHNLLSDEGIEIYNLGVDDSVSLHERLLTDDGNKVIDRYYDNVISLEPPVIETALESFLEAM